MIVSTEYAIHRAFSEKYGLDAGRGMKGPALAARYALAMDAEKRQPGQPARTLREWAEILRKAADYMEKENFHNG